MNEQNQLAVRAARATRIKELRAELAELLFEEAQEVCKEMTSLEAECIQLVEDGRLIDAVKLYRHKTGLTLMESKDMVEGLQRRITA